jgi:hypothetical protein
MKTDEEIMARTMSWAHEQIHLENGPALAVLPCEHPLVASLAADVIGAMEFGIVLALTSPAAAKRWTSIFQGELHESVQGRDALREQLTRTDDELADLVAQVVEDLVGP